MPSLFELARVQDERPVLSFASRVIPKLFLSFFSLLAVICLGIKSHVLLNTPREVFEACGYESLGTYLFISSIVVAGSFATGLVFAPCPDNRIGEEWPICNARCAADLLLWTLMFYWLSTFVLIATVWSNSSNVEELLPFFSGFYAGFSSTCASGNNVNNLALAFGVFKVESFMIMFGLIFGCPCLCCWCFYPDREEE